MKNILIILDGMEDIQYKELNNMTPLEFSKANFLLKAKFKKYICTTPKGFQTDSMNCILNLLGIKIKDIPVGRAYLEALANNIKVNENDLVLRANSVFVDKKKCVVSNYTGDILSTLEIFNNKCNFEIINVNEYRNLILIKEKSKYLKDLKTFPPHQNFGKNIKNILPKGNKVALELRNICINILNYGNISFIPWSPSVKSKISLYKGINKNGAVVCHTDIVKGISYALGLYCPNIKGTTGDIDTNLIEKAEMTLKLIKDYDFVILHLNGLDEASHRRNLSEKINFIKKIDTEVIDKIINKCEKNTKVTILSDHATLCYNGSHSDIPVAIYEFIAN